MAVYEVFSHPELRRYKTHVCTKATIIQILILILTFIPPLFIAYRSYGFWLKEAYYREQPDILFKKELLLVLDLQGEGQYVTYSTYPNYNQLQQAYLRLPVIKSREEDTNRDGLLDKLTFDLEMPLFDTEKVMGVKLLLFFYYRLNKFSSVFMESMAYVHHDSLNPGSRLQVYGDLRIKQLQPLAHKGIDTRYNVSILSNDSVYAEAFDLMTIFKRYASRNVTTVLRDPYQIWTSGRGTGMPFRISATVTYPEEVLLYTPGFWYLIKWGWIQYVAVLIIFLFLFSRLKIFIFRNQLVTTIVERPLKGNKGT